MYDTVAEILSSSYIGLGKPEPELITESELAQVVFERLNYYYQKARSSDQNLIVRVTQPFTIAAGSDEKDITALVEAEGYSISEPLWVERKLMDYSSNNPVWVNVPIINTDTISDRRQEWLVAASFYGDTPRQITMKLSVYGDELQLPFNYWRVWYAPGNVFSSDINQTIVIPENVSALVMIDTKIQAFGQMQVEAAKYIDKRPELAARMKAWDRMTMQLQTQKVEWMKVFTDFVNRSRSAHRAYNHIDVLQQTIALQNNESSFWGGF